MLQPKYYLNPIKNRLRDPQLYNSLASIRERLGQISRGYLFHLHLIGIVFKKFLLLIGYYAWDACMSSDLLLLLSTNELLYLIH